MLTGIKKRHILYSTKGNGHSSQGDKKNPDEAREETQKPSHGTNEPDDERCGKNSSRQVSQDGNHPKHLTRLRTR